MAGELHSGDWFCYPQVGHMVVFVYFHKSFMGLGCCLANLFELASDEQIRRGPDTVYAFEVPPEAMVSSRTYPVLYEDEANDMLVAAVPGKALQLLWLPEENDLDAAQHRGDGKLRRMPFHGRCSGSP